MGDYDCNLYYRQMIPRIRRYMFIMNIYHTMELKNKTSRLILNIKIMDAVDYKYLVLHNISILTVIQL